MDREQDIAVTMCLVLVVGFAAYTAVQYVRLYHTASKIYKNEGNAYKREELKAMMDRAFRCIKDNANQVAHPYFYNQGAEHVLATVPSFINVFMLCRYTLVYPQAKEDTNSILVETYGTRFEDNPELNVLVRVKTSEFGVQEYFHYVLEDIEKATEFYIRNRTYIDKVSKA